VGADAVALSAGGSRIHARWQSDPEGPDQGYVPSLLRRVADTIEALADVQIQDITFSSEVTGGEDTLMMTVYYHGDPRRR
jgi:hypothetical protein